MPFTTDFDYIYSDTSEGEVRAKTKEELINLIQSHGGTLDDFEECGVGGGNPQFFVSFPSKEKFVAFFVELWGKEFYNDEFAWMYGRVN